MREKVIYIIGHNGKGSVYDIANCMCHSFNRYEMVERLNRVLRRMCSDGFLSKHDGIYSLEDRGVLEFNKIRFKDPDFIRVKYDYNSGYKSLVNRHNDRFSGDIISFDEFKDLVSMPCYYCGTSHSKVGDVNGIDRIDSNIGYIEDNVVPCCAMCNRAKGTMHVKDFKCWLRNVEV